MDTGQPWTACTHFLARHSTLLALAVLTGMLGLAQPLDAATLKPSLLPNVEASTFQVVAAKSIRNSLTYASPLPTELIPYQERTDKYHQIGTAYQDSMDSRLRGNDEISD